MRTGSMLLPRVRIRDQAQTTRRYRYVLPQMATRCSDLPNAKRAADRRRVSVPEPIPPLVETLHRLIAEVAPAAMRAQIGLGVRVAQGRLPTPGPHRSVRARLTHTVPQVAGFATW